MVKTKKYYIIKAVCEGKKQKNRACVELGLTRRQVNRLVKAYHEKGKQTFVHGNRQKKSSRAIPLEVKEKIVEKYQNYELIRPNVLHFCELLAEEGIHYSDTSVRKILYQAGLLSPKTQQKTKKRIKQEAMKRKLEENSLLPSGSDFIEVEEKVHPSRPRKWKKISLLSLAMPAIS